MNITDLSEPNTAIINQLWRFFGVLVWLAATVILLTHYHDRLYSTSVDVGLHGTLVSRLIEDRQLPEVDENLAEMATYPRIAHSLAASVGAQANSAIDGMQVVADFSVVVLWSAIGYSLLRLPRRRRLVAFTALTVALFANRQWIGLEIFGSELVGTYFFAHFVGQAVAIGLLVAALQREWIEPNSFDHLLILGLGAPLLASVHLLPSVEVLGTLGIVVLLSVVVDAGAQRRRRLLAGGIIFLSSLLFTVINPDFAVMTRLSANNGLMIVKYFDSVRGMAMLTTGVALLSLGLIALWWRKRFHMARYEELLLKYLGAFGLSTSGLCAIQILLLFFFAKGSEYACFKYASGLQSIAIIDLAILFAMSVGDRRPATRSGPAVLAPTVLAGIAVFCAFPSQNYVLTDEIVAAEREARTFVRTNGGSPPGKHDLAIGISDIHGIGNYLVSRLALRAPTQGEAFDVLLGKAPADALHINRILTSEYSNPWDIPACRRGRAGSLVALDATCVYAEFKAIDCKGTIEFSSAGAFDKATRGFSHAEPRGRWNDGPSAMLTCEHVDPRIKKALLESTGFVTDSHSQRMILSINGGTPQTVEFTMQEPSRTIEIPVPADSSSQLTFRFSFPDAASPAELGMSTDARKLAVFINKLRFE